MTRTRAIRILVIVVCVSGIAGMIVTSATNHNGAAITFGLITAVAILCQMVATTVANEDRGSTEPRLDEAEASRLEARIDELVAAGADEAAVRDLARHAVRLGRTSGAIATSRPSDS